MQSCGHGAVVRRVLCAYFPLQKGVYILYILLELGLNVAQIVTVLTLITYVLKMELFPLFPEISGIYELNKIFVN